MTQPELHRSLTVQLGWFTLTLNEGNGKSALPCLAHPALKGGLLTVSLPGLLDGLPEATASVLITPLVIGGCL